MNFREHGYVGWALNKEQRASLLRAFPPAYSKVIAHHVTRLQNISPHFVPHQTDGMIIGYSHDLSLGIEAFVVSIDGSFERPDGGVFHITWSLDPKRDCKPWTSNVMLEKRGWTDFVSPIRVLLEPRFFSNTVAYY